MRIATLGLGVIGTTYAYVFQKVGHRVKHILRSSRWNSTPKSISVNLLDGRCSSKGESKHDTYEVQVAEAHSEYDFISLSVCYGFAKKTMKTLQENNIKGTLVFFYSFWDIRREIQEWAGEYDYILAFPTTSGYMTEDHLDDALLDHLILEDEQKAKILNYVNLTTLLTSVDLKWEVPRDTIEWIWIHVVINAGVIPAAAHSGRLEDPEELALSLMNSSSELSLAIKAIRGALKVVEARGVDLKLYEAELLLYKVPAWPAGRAMKVMFTKNEMTRKIMTLHNDKRDIFYCCQNVLQTGQELGIKMPILEANMRGISI